MKILLVNTLDGLKPMYDEDFNEKKKLKIGKAYEADIKLIRNYEFHKKYFSLLNIAWNYLNEKQQLFFNNNFNVFRKSIEIIAGHCEKIYNYTLKSWIDIPKSISFDSMDEAEFQELYNNVRDILLQTYLKHITEKQFNEILDNFG